MRAPTNEGRAVYNNAVRAQSVGRPFFIVITEADRAAMHERARLDIERIAQAAGVKMRRTAHIAVRRGMRQEQEKGLKELNKLLQDIRTAGDRERAITQTGIATGYANAMSHFGLISESELKDVIEVIGQAGERAADRHFWPRIIRKLVRI